MDNYNGPFKGEEGYYGSQKLRHKSFWQRYRWFVISIGALVILLVIFATSTFYLLSSRPQASTPPPFPVIGQTPPVTSPGTSTSVPVAAATPTVLATVPPGTFTEPNGGLKLHTNADDPVTVTITSMTYNPNENKMVWNLTLQDVSSLKQDVTGGKFTLKSDAEGDNYTHDATLASLDTAIAPGDQVQKTITFTFVPYQKASGVSYTLTSSIDAHYIDGIIYGDNVSITFDPMPITF